MRRVVGDREVVLAKTSDSVLDQPFSFRFMFKG
jgi:hypothetical protein